MSLRARVLDAGAEAGYPLSRETLLSVLEGDDEASLVVQAMADHSFVAAEELNERLDDALGMPGSDPNISAINATTEWPSDD